VTGRGGPDLTAEEAARLGRLGTEGTRGEAELTLLVKTLLDAETEMRRSPHPRVDLEVAIVRLCHRPDPQAIETVLARLEAAESRLRGYGGSGSLGADAAAPVQADLLGGPTVPGGSLPGAAPGPPPAPPTPPTPPTPVVGSTGRPPREAADATATWGRIVAEITRLRPSLGQILEGAVVVSEEAGRLTVAVPNGNAFTREQLKLPANRELLIQATRRVQPDIRDVTLTTELPAGVPAAAVPDHPRVKAALALFDGEIAAIRPSGSGVRAPGPEEEA
jgi:hypothetical protein